MNISGQEQMSNLQLHKRKDIFWFTVSDVLLQHCVEELFTWLQTGRKKGGREGDQGKIYPLRIFPSYLLSIGRS